MWLPPEKQKLSQVVLPTISPPASSIRVTIVASTSGTKPRMTELPFVILHARHADVVLDAHLLSRQKAGILALYIALLVPGA